METKSSFLLVFSFQYTATCLKTTENTQVYLGTKEFLNIEV